MLTRLDAAAVEGKEKGVKGLPARLGMEMAARMIAEIKSECPPPLGLQSPESAVLIKGQLL